MPRTPDPSKRAGLLSRCVQQIISAGTLDLHLEVLAAAVGTSARMLIYHFGTKDALHIALIEAVEDLLRRRFTEAAEAQSPEGRAGTRHSAAAVRAVLETWDALVTPKMRGLLSVSAELRHRALHGDADARRVTQAQTRAWRDLLEQWGISPSNAHAVLMLVDGATTHYLLTGDARAGRQALARMLAASP